MMVADTVDTVENFKVAGFNFKADKSLFEPTLDFDTEKKIFKQFVTRIVLETSSYCNRQCVFCPNVDGSRLGKQMRLATMPSTLVQSIAEALAEIDYDETIFLHLYNEPTADPELAEKIKLLRDQLPKAKLAFNTNGDYLKRQLLEQLVLAGLNHMSVSLYGPQHGRFDENYLRNAFGRVFEVAGAKATIRQVGATHLEASVTFRHADRALPIRVFATDFNEVGYDRAKSVSTKKVETRTAPCPAPFTELNVAWDGHAVPCCNIQPEQAVRDGQSVGKVLQGKDIFHIFSGRALRGWRRSLALYGDYASPCDSCTRFNETKLSQAASIHNEKMQHILDEASISA